MPALDVQGLPFLLPETLGVARTFFNGTEQIEALTTFSLATPVLAEARPPAVPTGVLTLAMLANPFATTIFALGFALSMLAERGATTFPALGFDLVMWANRSTATLNTTLAPLQMHTFDDRHYVAQRGEHKGK